jgi:DNA polymerase-3 subunit delta
VAEELGSLYLIAGTDGAKVDATRARLRSRAESEGGAAALEVFEGEGRAAPDHEALLATLPAMSLTGGRRYLLADGVERWRDRQLDAVLAALDGLPPDVCLVLIARGDPPAKLRDAVERAGGEVHVFAAPTARAMPGALVEEAARLGFRLEPEAARALVERMGAGPVRLANELRRLATWAGEGGSVTLEDLDAMVADSSEAIVWSLADALEQRDPAAALSVSERLVAQGESVSGMVYALASRMRRSRGADLRGATEALADLEVWCRGGADYGDELALTLALRRATAGA